MRVQRERDVLKREKEEEVSALHSKLHVMEKSYDAILQVCYTCSLKSAYYTYHLYMHIGCSGFIVWQDGGSETEMGLRVT